MEERADDWWQVSDNLSNADITNSTPNKVRLWMKDWALYVKNGGTRPPVRPPI